MMRLLAVVLLLTLLCVAVPGWLSAGPGGGRFRGRGDGEEGGGRGRKGGREGGAFFKHFKDASPECRAELRKLSQELRQKSKELREEYEKKADAMMAECKVKHPAPPAGTLGTPQTPGTATDDGEGEGDAGGASPAEAAPSAAPAAAPSAAPADEHK